MKKLHFLALAAMMVAGNLQAEMEYTDLTADMFHAWTTAGADATMTDAVIGCAYELGVSTGLPYGDGSVVCHNYANLSEYDVLVVETTDGEPRFCMNRNEVGVGGGDNNGGSVAIEFPRDYNGGASYESVEGKTYTINLKAIVEDYGFAHLNCIKGANWANVTVVSMKLGKEAAAAATIGEPQWGLDRFQLPEEMIMLGVPVRFPEMVLPCAIEECEITVSASLYGIPQGNEPMPISADDDVDPGFNVDGPVCLAEAQLHVASVEGGVATAYLFGEQLEVDNHYAIVLNAVTVMKDGEIVAELPEDAYLAIEFDVVPSGPHMGFGEPVWLLDGDDELGYSIAEDQAMLGVALTFPDAVLPENATVAATVMLYGFLPEGAEGGIMPLDDDDDDIDPGFNVTPSTLPLWDEPEQIIGYVEGGVVRFNIGAEELAVGNFYAVEVEKVVACVDDVEVLVAEEPIKSPVFTVVEATVPATIGEPVWGLDGTFDDGFYLAGDMVALGVQVSFPDLTLPVPAEDCDITVSASLYGVPTGNEPMPISADDDIDPGFNVDGPVCIADAVLHNVNVEGGVASAFLFPEMMEEGNTYAIVLNAVTVIKDGEIIAELGEEDYYGVQFEVVVYEPEEELAIEPSFIAGEEVIALNGHAAVSVETAEALRVNFVNGPMIWNASYAIDKKIVDEEGDESFESLSSGFLSLSGFGYVEFEEPLTFISGSQYVLTVKAWDVQNIFDENWTMAEPIAVQEFVFNGAAATGVIGEPVWGIERMQLTEDMINLGVKVSFPELTLPFGVVAEDCEIAVSATLYGVPEGNEPMPLSADDVDDNMGVDGPVALADQLVYADMEGGVASAYLFAEQMEVGNHYAIVLNAVTVTLDGEIVAELPEDAYYACDFVVVQNQTVGISNIAAENNGKVMFNLFGQKVNKANGVVVLEGAKAIVK